jgi:fructose-1,6-bisphosphatase I
VEGPVGGSDAAVDAVIERIAAETGGVREAIARHRGYLDDHNESGDRQLAADLRADERFERTLLDVPAVGTYASEEQGEPVREDGRLHVAIDPLDGSSNLLPNAGMGTVFGVYDEPLPATGRSLVAAGFVIYGPTTTLIVAREGTVREYVVGEESLKIVEEDLTLPDEPAVFGFGGGVEEWSPAFRAYVADLREELKLRYGGSMVADVSQVLTYGGVFGYPALDSRPAGKLRLQLEGHAVGYVVEAAGGRASDGTGPLLDRRPDGIHDPAPTFVGNEESIDRLEAALADAQ